MKHFFLFAILLLISCGRNVESKKLTKLDRSYALLQKLAKLGELSTPAADKQSGLYYCATPLPGKDEKSLSLKGKIIPDLEEQTLLNTVYGSCYKKEDHYEFNFGKQMFDESDSVYMRLETILGNDSLALVYLKGEVAITCANYCYFNETALALKKTSQGWKITDASVDQGRIDAQKPELAGIFGGRMLLKYITFGVYAGGVSYGSDEYIWLKPDSLTGPRVSFITESSNTASDQCMSQYHEECDCYEKGGAVKFRYLSNWNCIVFDYNFEMTRGDCEMKKPVTQKIKQKWYMSNDTSFMSSGNELDEWGDGILGKINLRKDEIKKRLNVF